VKIMKKLEGVAKVNQILVTVLSDRALFEKLIELKKFDEIFYMFQLIDNKGYTKIDFCRAINDMLKFFKEEDNCINPFEKIFHGNHFFGDANYVNDSKPSTDDDIEDAAGGTGWKTKFAAGTLATLAAFTPFSKAKAHDNGDSGIVAMDQYRESDQYNNDFDFNQKNKKYGEDIWKGVRQNNLHENDYDDDRDTAPDDEDYQDLGEVEDYEPGDIENPQEGGQSQENPIQNVHDQNNDHVDVQNPQEGGQVQYNQQNAQNQNNAHVNIQDPQDGGQVQDNLQDVQDQNNAHGGIQNPQDGGQVQDNQQNAQDQNNAHGGIQNPQNDGQVQDNQQNVQDQNNAHVDVQNPQDNDDEELAIPIPDCINSQVEDENIPWYQRLRNTVGNVFSNIRARFSSPSRALTSIGQLGGATVAAILAYNLFGYLRSLVSVSNLDTGLLSEEERKEIANYGPSEALQYARSRGIIGQSNSDINGITLGKIFGGLSGLTPVWVVSLFFHLLVDAGTQVQRFSKFVKDIKGLLDSSTEMSYNFFNSIDGFRPIEQTTKDAIEMSPKELMDYYAKNIIGQRMATDAFVKRAVSPFITSILMHMKGYDDSNFAETCENKFIISQLSGSSAVGKSITVAATANLFANSPLVVPLFLNFRNFKEGQSIQEYLQSDTKFEKIVRSAKNKFLFIVIDEIDKLPPRLRYNVVEWIRFVQQYGFITLKNGGDIPVKGGLFTIVTNAIPSEDLKPFTIGGDREMCPIERSVRPNVMDYEPTFSRRMRPIEFRTFGPYDMERISVQKLSQLSDFYATEVGLGIEITRRFIRNMVEYMMPEVPRQGARTFTVNMMPLISSAITNSIANIPLDKKLEGSKFKLIFNKEKGEVEVDPIYANEVPLEDVD